jgi:hypothetical protein
MTIDRSHEVEQVCLLFFPQNALLGWQVEQAFRPAVKQQKNPASAGEVNELELK